MFTRPATQSTDASKKFVKGFESALKKVLKPCSGNSCNTQSGPVTSKTSNNSDDKEDLDIFGLKKNW
jgi:hypothetical protein